MPDTTVIDPSDTEAALRAMLAGIDQSLSDPTRLRERLVPELRRIIEAGRSSRTRP